MDNNKLSHMHNIAATFLDNNAASIAQKIKSKYKWLTNVSLQDIHEIAEVSNTSPMELMRDHFIGYQTPISIEQEDKLMGSYYPAHID